MKSALHMTTKELLDNYGVPTGGIRKVPSNVLQALLAGVDSMEIQLIRLGNLTGSPRQAILIDIPKFKIDLGKFHDL